MANDDSQANAVSSGGQLFTVRARNQGELVNVVGPASRPLAEPFQKATPLMTEVIGFGWMENPYLQCTRSI